MFTGVSVGDTVKIRNRADNAAMKAGYYYRKVVVADAHSFGVQSVASPWWFYRDNGEAYGGDAVVVRVVRVRRG